MAIYLLKRKDIEYVNDDLSDFSLVSPATKIRRLDAELPPIVEEDEPDFPWWIKTPAASVGVDNLASNIMSRTGSSSQVMVEMPATSENVDRAIILFNPTPLPLSASRFSIDSDILSGIKKNIHLSNHSSLVTSAEEEEEGRKNSRRNECLAVIPWNPSLQQLRCTATSGNMQGELKEDEQMGEATIMDIEEDNTSTEYYSQQMNENLRQWQQQQQYSHMNENLLQWQQQQQQQYSHMNENLLQWQQHQQQQQYSHMNENLLQWQQQQQQQQYSHMNENLLQWQQQQQQHSQMNENLLQWQLQ